MTSCKMCETNKRSRLTTFTFPDTQHSIHVCKECDRWLTKKFNSSTRGEWRE